MARMGLGPGWKTLFANDFDPSKAAAYAENWGSEGLLVEDVAKVSTKDLPGEADLAWASFPCQDLSLAGAGRGLGGERSGTFWPFWRLIEGLSREGRPPKVIALENVYGAVRSHGGKDFAAIGEAMASAGYRYGALLIDAERFLPQSRLRLFIVGVLKDAAVPDGLQSQGPIEEWHPRPLREAVGVLGEEARNAWVWWHLPKPTHARPSLSDVIEDTPTGVEWDSADHTQYLLNLMSEVNLSKVHAALANGKRHVGTVYRRTRRDPGGGRVQRAEARCDGGAGCLRTPSGGSSRQTVLIVEDGHVRSRLLSPRETARLMGLPDDYRLPAKYNAAYHLTGDGVAVPVVRHLAASLFEPLLEAESRRTPPQALVEGHRDVAPVT